MPNGTIQRRLFLPRLRRVRSDSGVRVVICSQTIGHKRTGKHCRMCIHENLRRPVVMTSDLDQPDDRLIISEVTQRPASGTKI